MKKIKLGSVECSEYIFGMWRIKDGYDSPQDVTKLILKLEELGINTLDTAQVYGGGLHQAEAMLSDLFSDKNRRQRFKLITKSGIGGFDENGETIYGFYDFSYKNLIKSVNVSLETMNTEYIDVFLLHRPDYFADFAEIAMAFNEIREAKKVLEFGVSNFTPTEFASLQKYLDKYEIKLVTNQIEVNPYCKEHFENGNLFYLKGQEISPMIWSPYGGGKLFTNEGGQNKVLYDLAKKYDTYVEEIVLSYIKKTNTNPAIILGSNRYVNYEKIKNFKGIELTKQEVYQILNECAEMEIR